MNLPGREFNPAGGFQMFFGLLVTGFVGPFQAHQAGQRRRQAAGQAKRHIGWIMADVLDLVIVVIALQRDRSKNALHGDGDAALARKTRFGWIRRIDLIGQHLKQVLHQLTGVLEDGGAQEHFEVQGRHGQLAVVGREQAAH